MNSRNRIGIGSAVIVAVLLIGGGFALADNGTHHPASMNPNKQPVVDPSQLKPEVSSSMTPAQMEAIAIVWKAADRNSHVVCFRPDGSVAGGASLNRVDPSAPLTIEAADAVCKRGFPGSGS